MKQIIYLFLVMLVWVAGCSAPEKAAVGDQRVFRITHAESSGPMFSEIWTGPRLEALGMLEISSEYFDRAMHVKDSRFSTVAFSRLLEHFQLKRGEDAVLLNCFDDYQGILSFNDKTDGSIQPRTTAHRRTYLENMAAQAPRHMPSRHEETRPCCIQDPQSRVADVRGSDNKSYCLH